MAVELACEKWAKRVRKAAAPGALICLLLYVISSNSHHRHQIQQGKISFKRVVCKLDSSSFPILFLTSPASKDDPQFIALLRHYQTPQECQAAFLHLLIRLHDYFVSKLNTELASIGTYCYWYVGDFFLFDMWASLKRINAAYQGHLWQMASLPIRVPLRLSSTWLFS